MEADLLLKQARRIGRSAAGTAAPRNRDRERAPNPPQKFEPVEFQSSSLLLVAGEFQQALSALNLPPEVGVIPFSEVFLVLPLNLSESRAFPLIAAS